MDSDDPWHDAFTRVVLNPLRSIDEAVAAYTANDYLTMKQLSNAGIVSAVADEDVSLWEAFRYQRAHADAMRDLFVTWDVAACSGRISVLDVGCGAATVAVALTEALRLGGSRRSFDYFGVDHNPHAVDLALAMLDDSGATARRDATVDWDLARASSNAAAGLRRSSVPIVTTSYLLNQRLSVSFVGKFSDAVARLVEAADEVGLFVYYLGVDASHNNWQPLDRVIDALEQVGVRCTVELREWTDHESRFPSLYPRREGRYRPSKAGQNNLLRWILRLQI